MSGEAMHRLSDRGLLSVWSFGNLSSTELMISVFAFRDGAVAWLASWPTERTLPWRWLPRPTSAKQSFSRPRDKITKLGSI